MATAQSATKPGGKPKYEAMVDQQLGAARRRFQGLAWAGWGLVLASVILAYGLVVSFADLRWELPRSVRLGAWWVFGAILATLVASAAIKLLFRQINPRFLAWRLEKTVPEAKNSLLNWLDLRQETMAPVIRASLGRRAAKDISQADAEQALSGRPVYRLCGLALALLLIQFVWLIAAPGQVWSLLQRAFFPFEASPIALRTSLTLKVPDPGDISVPANKGVEFRVQADGYVPAVNNPDSLHLHFRYHQDEPYEARALQRDVDGIWTATIHSDQVRTGFWYKVTGGDARLPLDRDYRIDVLGLAQVLRFETGFQYRKYLGLPDRTLVFEKNVRPNFKELRGTQVTLTVLANRPLQQCVVELEVGGEKKLLASEIVEGADDRRRFTWVLEQSGQFRVLFTANDGAKNVDRQPCKFEVIPDHPPEAVLTQPARDVTLPANGTLYLEGQATDDFGVKTMQLRFKLVKAPNLVSLRAKPYRPGVSFALDNGKYPLRLDYSDYVAMDTLVGANGEPYPLAAGMELEYWLEARDNCDYPDSEGNVGQSARYKVTIVQPEPDSNKAAQDRQQAQQKAQQNQKQQDSSLDAQNLQAKAQQDAGGGGNQKPHESQRNELEQQAQQVQKAIDEANKPGTAKGPEHIQSAENNQSPKDDPSPSGQGKNADPKDANKKGNENTGPEKNQGDGAGQNKGPGQAAGNPKDEQIKPGDAKDKGQASDSKEPPGSTKGGDSKAGEGSSAAKNANQQSGKDDTGQAKGPQGQGEKGPEVKGPAKTDTPPPGTVKSMASSDNKEAKGKPTADNPNGEVKGSERTDQPPPPEAKIGPADSSKDAGSAKAADRKDSTLNDVAELREQLGEAGRREQAQKDLERIVAEADKEKVRQAAEKALAEAQKQPGQSKDMGQAGDTNPDQASGKTAGKMDELGAAAAAGKSAPEMGAAKSKEAADPGQAQAKAKSETRPDGAGDPDARLKGGGVDNPLTPDPVDEAAARRAGQLQLETLMQQIDKLRDKFSPKVMEELKWTEKDKEEFLRKMMADALQRQQNLKTAGGILPPPGSVQSLLPATGPRQLQNIPAQQGAVVVENAEAPPDVRDALRHFLANPTGLKKKR